MGNGKRRYVYAFLLVYKSVQKDKVILRKANIYVDLESVQ